MLRAVPPESERSLIAVDVTRAPEQADAIERLVEGSMAGVIVRGVVAPAQATQLVQRLESSASSLPTFRPPVFKGYVLGKPLVSSGADLGGYLDDADRFRAAVATIYSAYAEIEERVHAALAALAGGRPLRVPLARGGRAYLAATIRKLIEGDRLPLHYENETLHSPAMSALRPLLDPSTLLSFYMPLAIPPAGGLLRLFRTHCLDGGDSLIERLGGEAKARVHFEEKGFEVVLPGVGDLLVFDGGRWYHDVTPVEGGARWTLGGFLAVTRDHALVHYWS